MERVNRKLKEVSELRKLFWVAVCCAGLLVSCQKEESGNDGAAGKLAAEQLNNNINSARCNEVPKNFARIMDQVVMYEAVNGYWPTDISMLDIAVESKFFDYELLGTANGDKLVIKAVVKSGKKIGEISTGDFITVDNEGNKAYSHSDFADKFMKAYLYNATYTRQSVSQKSTVGKRVTSKRLIKAHCSEIPLNLKRLMDQAVMYEAETGLWPTMKELNVRGYKNTSDFFTYDLKSEKGNNWVVATVKPDVRLGSIGGGEEVRISFEGDKVYTHFDFPVYMEAFLAGAKKE